MKKILPVIILFLFLQATYGQESGFITSFDSTRIYYEVSGRGPAILLVHGFIVNSDSWKRTALYTNLMQEGFKVITLDLRGNGQSDRPHMPEAYEKDAEARDIMALADFLELKKYSVVGYSRGAIITSRVLLLDDRVDQGVLGGMGVDFTNPAWPRRIMFYEALMGKPVKELEGAIKYVKEQNLDELALAYMQKGQPTTSKKELRTLKKPVLVICGTADEDSGSSLELASLISGSEYVRVPGNHNNASRSKEFAEAVTAFLKKNSR